jgi:hypothetical protein
MANETDIGREKYLVRKVVHESKRLKITAPEHSAYLVLPNIFGAIFS